MTSYSKYWRKNRSPQEATELSMSLKALRKVAAHMGKDINPVIWKGMDGDNNSILLDPEKIQGRYPIPDKEFDILVATVALEGLASLEETDWIRNKVRKGVTEFSENEKPYLKSLLETAECIYLDEFAKPHVWGFYLPSLWMTELFWEKRDPLSPPTPESLSFLWKRKAILGTYPEEVHYYYDQAFDILTDYTEAIRNIALFPSLSDRRDKRLELYSRLWNAISKIISKWEELQFDTYAMDRSDDGAPKEDLSDEEGDRETMEDDETQAGGALEWDLAEQVRSIVEDEKAGSYAEVAPATPYTGARPMETVVRRSDIKSDVRPDESQIKRLRKIFKEHEMLVRRSSRRNIRRGLIEGKVDARRLHRVPINEKVFKNKQAPGPENLWQICIVADASASMAGEREKLKPWYVAEKAFASIAAAAAGFRNVLDIYAYSAENNVCTLSKLWHEGELYSVLPRGRTPSGQAVMTAARLLKKKTNRKQKKRMIIHITDGAANCGLPLNVAVNFCHNNNMEVYTIGCGCTLETRDLLRESFPLGHVYFMRDITGLSLGLEYLFKRKILNLSE